MKSKFEIKANYWGYPEDDHGYWIDIIKDGKRIWKSSWYETDDLDDVKELKEEIQNAAIIFEQENSLDIISDYPPDWHFINSPS